MTPKRFRHQQGDGRRYPAALFTLSKQLRTYAAFLSDRQRNTLKKRTVKMAKTSMNSGSYKEEFVYVKFFYCLHTNTQSRHGSFVLV